MDRLWLDAPLPALRVRPAAGAAAMAPNDAALRWARQHGVSEQALHDLARIAPRSGPVVLAGRAGALVLDCHRIEMDDGFLLWLAGAAVDAASTERARVVPDRAMGLAGVSIDLTRQFDERDRVEVPDERTRLVVRALGVGFSTRDIDTDEALWDEQMCRIYGVDPAQAPFTGGQWLQRCVHPQDRARVTIDIRDADAGAGGDDVVESEFRMPDREGQERWAHSWVRRMVRGGRRIAYGMHMDVTERKRAEALLLQRQRLEQAERERSEFMARMSHELRTPMNAVLGFTQLLRDDPVQPPSARQRERLECIADAGAEMMRLVDSLLATARRSPGQALAPPQDPARGLHVLCVEDNPVNLQLVRELMALRPGVRLSTAVDGRSGIACACAEPPDLVLLDLQLPDMGGVDVLRRLRAESTLARSRIVALSADAMPGHIEAALAAGFDDYWTKPIQFDRFLAGIDGLGAELGR